MNVTMDDLMRIIGVLFVENTMLRKELEELQKRLETQEQGRRQVEEAERNVHAGGVDTG